MRLLLDTHIWIWAVVEPARLSRRVTRALQENENELWLSPISTWELALLVERGRIRLDSDIDPWLADASDCCPTIEAPLTHEIALASTRVALPHRDPADRLLAATALILDLALVTADEQLIGCKGVRVLANK